MFKQVSSKVNFSQLESETLKYWQENKILEKYLARNKDSKEKFKFLDGPITANNPMGVHHAWGRTYKDLWQRFFNMLGRRQRFQNGFDEQGLWVEVEVEKDLGLKTKNDITIPMYIYIHRCTHLINMLVSCYYSPQLARISIDKNAISGH